MKSSIEWKTNLENGRWILRNCHHYWPVLLLIILMGAVSSLGTVVVAVASKHMIDSAVKGDLQAMAAAAAMFGGIVLGTILINLGASLLAIRVSESMSNTIRQRIFRKLTGAEWLLLSGYHSGDLVTRLTSDVGTVTGVMVNVVPGIVSLGVQFLAAFFTLLHYEPKLAVLAFVLGPVTVLFSRIWGRKLKTIHIEVQESESRYRAYIQEALQHLLIVKTFQLEDYSQERLQTLHKNRLGLVIRRNRLNVAAGTSLGVGFWTGYLIAFSWGAYRLSQKAISFGTMTAFLQLIQQVQVPFVGLSKTYPQLIASLGSAARLMELEALDKERTAGLLPKVKRLGIRARQVSFTYPTGQPVLNRINLQINPGEVVALVGSSGEGKTTLIRLLLSLVRPEEGQVQFFDGIGAYDVSAATRAWVTYVPQGNTLFSGTIAENLRRGNPEASFAEIEQALAAAGAWAFIKELPHGIETVIGEGGLGISEGQAQRIAIARAFLKKAPIMILDEATSALDGETELQVLNAIQSLGHRRTCLIITHRPSALRICSRVLRLENGILSECPHESGWLLDAAAAKA
ncbi:MAG: ABC transporter ATP-binding protein [Solirubrobacterales bacterium]